MYTCLCTVACTCVNMWVCTCASVFMRVCVHACKSGMRMSAWACMCIYECLGRWFNMYLWPGRDGWEERECVQQDNLAHSFNYDIIFSDHELWNTEIFVRQLFKRRKENPVSVKSTNVIWLNIFNVSSPLFMHHSIDPSTAGTWPRFARNTWI